MVSTQSPLRSPAGKCRGSGVPWGDRQEGYNSVHPEKAGWRYGFVAVTQEGKSVYGEMGNNTEGVVKYIAPKDVPLAHLWLVVMGAPTEHWMNPISGEKDAQWPYKIKITGSFLLTSAN